MIFVDEALHDTPWTAEARAHTENPAMGTVKVRMKGSEIALIGRRKDFERLRSMIEAVLMEMSLAEAERSMTRKAS